MPILLWLSAFVCLVTASPSTLVNTETETKGSAFAHSHVWEPRFPVKPFSKSSMFGRIKIPLRQPPDSDFWVADMAFGAPPQEVSLAIDTLSSSIWVINFDLSPVHHFYNHTKSSTYTPNGTTFEQEYQGISGFLSQDDLIISKDIIIMWLPFCEVNDTRHNDIEKYVPVDGVIGLGFQSPDASAVYSDFAEFVQDSKALDEPVYGIYLGRSKQGELTLGGVERQYYRGEIEYHNVVLSNPWTLHLNSIQAYELNITTPITKVVVSPLTPYIIGPKDQVNQLATVVGINLETGTINCDAVSPPDIVFTIDGTAYTLTKDDYLYPEGDNVCLFGIKEIDLHLPGDPVWILGGAFMRRYYTIFDFGTKKRAPRIGFALTAGA